MSKASSPESRSKVINTKEALLARSKTILTDGRIRSEETANLFGATGLASANGTSTLLGFGA